MLQLYIFIGLLKLVPLFVVYGFHEEISSELYLIIAEKSLPDPIIDLMSKTAASQ